MALKDRLLNLLDRAVSGDPATLPRAAKRTREVLNRIAPGAGDRLPKGSVPALIKANEILGGLVTGESGPAPSATPAAAPAPGPAPAKPVLTYAQPEPGKGPAAMLANFERSVGLRRQTPEAKPAAFKLTLEQLRRLAVEIFGSEKVGMTVPPEPIWRDEKLAKRIVRAESSTHEMNLLRQELARRPGQSASEKQEEHDRQYRKLCGLFYEGGLTLPGVDFQTMDFDPLTPAQLAAPKASPRTHALAQRIIDDFAATLQGDDTLTQRPHQSRGAQAALTFMRGTKER